MAEEFRDVQARARELDVFVEDRALLCCPECGLAEDVLAGGLLVTCRSGSPGLDTGLRFVESAGPHGLHICPEYGAEAMPDEYEPRRR